MMVKLCLLLTCQIHLHSQKSHLSIVACAKLQILIWEKQALFWIVILRIEKEKDPIPAQIFLHTREFSPDVQETLNSP